MTKRNDELYGPLDKRPRFLRNSEETEEEHWQKFAPEVIWIREDIESMRKRQNIERLRGGMRRWRMNYLYGPLDKRPGFLRNSEGKFYTDLWAETWGSEEETEEHWKGVAPEVRRICDEVRAARIEHGKNRFNTENLKRWAVALRDLADMWPIPATDDPLVMHWLEVAKSKLEESLRINKDDYEAKYELGMVYYYMMRSDNGVARVANYVNANACFRSVKSQAPEFYREDVLELLNNQIPTLRTKLKERLVHSVDDEEYELVPESECGALVGRLKFTAAHNTIDYSKTGGGAFGLPLFEGVRNYIMESDAKFILLVEKSDAFDCLLFARFYDVFPCIVVHALGGPDWATKSVVELLKEKLNLPVYGLVDCSPRGLMYLYKYGCESLKLKWLGLRPSDMARHDISGKCMSFPMTTEDINDAKGLLKEPVVKERPDWAEELTLMVKTGRKYELEALYGLGMNYLVKTYLPLKLLEEGFYRATCSSSTS